MFLLLVIPAIALLSPVGRLLGLYTDWLWFRAVQFTSVFVTVLRTEVLLGVVTGAAPTRVQAKNCVAWTSYCSNC